MNKDSIQIPENEENVKKKIQKLREEIRYHNRKYFVEDDPVISDYEYDRLFEELKTLENEFPKFVTKDSPTQRVGIEKIDEFEIVEHKAEMLSLDKSNDKENLKDFDKKVRNALNRDQIEYVIEPKIDGLGVALLYENKSFQRGATRGDGAKGEDITANLKTIKSIPLKLTENTILKTVEVRGEVYIPRDEFKKINEERIQNKQEEFANPRNAASGTIRRKHPHEVANIPLDIFIYNLSYTEDIDFETHLETLTEMEKAGFKINTHQKVDGIGEVFKSIDEWQKKKEELNYEIDGMVIKVNNLEAHEILGSTTHHPRWAIAFKYPPNRKTTKVLNIEIMVGRTGKLTPVAVLEPIQLSGTEVSRASLHNEDEVEKKDIRIGDIVLVEKAGEIIPQIIKAMKEKRNGDEKKFEMPRICPVCRSVAKRFNGEVARRCINAQCPAQIKQRIEHWGDRNAMNINGLGPKLLNKLVEKGIVKNIADIYDLKISDLEKIERMGKKSSKNLLDEIEHSKHQGLERVLFGLGITFVGKHIANILTENFKTIDSLMKTSKEKLESIEGLGPKISQSIVSFFNEKNNIELIQRLKISGVKMEINETGYQNDFLNGKKFVFTGALDNYTRDEASEEVRKYGGRVTNNISGETDFLVIGKKPGSKLEDAKKEEKIKILNETQFIRILKEKKIV
jgi:DNA ligase (NAD+)